MKMSMATVFLLITLAAGAQPEAALTMDEAVAVARERNPALRVARERGAAAAGWASQAGLWPNPELELVAEDVPVDGGGLSESQNSVGLSQTIPFPGKTRLAVRAAVADARRVDWEWRALECEAIRSVKVAFGEALAAERRRSIADDMVKLAGLSVETAGKRVAAGAASAQESLRAEIELDRARAVLQAMESEEVAAHERLAMAMGDPDARARPLAGALAESADTNLLAAAGGLHPLLAAAASECERTESAWRRARHEWLPDVTIGASIGRDAREDETVASWSVSLPLPLFDRSQGGRRAAAADHAAARSALDGAEQRLQGERAVAEAQWRAAAATVRAERERTLPKAEEALRLVRTGFEAGKFGLIDLLDTQRMLAEARLAHEENLLALHTALADIEALTTRELEGQ